MASWWAFSPSRFLGYFMYAANALSCSAHQWTVSKAAEYKSNLTYNTICATLKHYHFIIMVRCKSVYDPQCSFGRLSNFPLARDMMIVWSKRGNINRDALVTILLCNTLVVARCCRQLIGPVGWVLSNLQVMDCMNIFILMKWHLHLSCVKNMYDCTCKGKTRWKYIG